MCQVWICGPRASPVTGQPSDAGRALKLSEPRAFPVTWPHSGSLLTVQCRERKGPQVARCIAGSLELEPSLLNSKAWSSCRIHTSPSWNPESGCQDLFMRWAGQARVQSKVIPWSYFLSKSVANVHPWMLFCNEISYISSWEMSFHLNSTAKYW